MLCLFLRRKAPSHQPSRVQLLLLLLLSSKYNVGINVYLNALFISTK